MEHIVLMLSAISRIRTQSGFSAELEDGYEDYSEYKGDGGTCPPQLNHQHHGYIHFANGVRGYYAGGPKTTQSGFRAEIVGTNGYILINDRGCHNSPGRFG